MAPLPEYLLPKKMKQVLSNLDRPFPELFNQYNDYNPMGYFCSYWPEEISLAAGMEPLRVLPAGRGVPSPSRLPAYCCSLARGCLEHGTKTSEMVFGFAHTCDTIQCLGQIWPHAASEKTIFFTPPVALRASGALDYSVAELEKACQRLSDYGSPVDGNKLGEAIAICNRVRKVVYRLDKMRAFLPSQLIASMIRAAQLTPRQLYLEAMEETLPLLEAHQSEDVKVKVLISGAVFESEELHALLEELGARVAYDDSCTGFRHHHTLVNENINPLEAVAQRFLGRINCPCRHQEVNARARFLIEAAREREAVAAVLVLRKYCDPHAWDVVSLSKELRSAGIATTVLELEGATPGGQERTRLQAFLESLGRGVGLD